MIKTILTLITVFLLSTAQAQSVGTLIKKEYTSKPINPSTVIAVGGTFWALSGVFVVSGLVIGSRNLATELDEIERQGRIKGSLYIIGGVFGTVGLITTMVGITKKAYTEGYKVGKSAYLKDKGNSLVLTCKF